MTKYWYTIRLTTGDCRSNWMFASNTAEFWINVTKSMPTIVAAIHSITLDRIEL